MHPSILGVAFGAALAAGAVAARAEARVQPCPAPRAAVLERFIGADCVECWRSAPRDAHRAGEWLFDWIVPSSARGDDAPLAPAAPAEASARWRRAIGTADPDAGATGHRSIARRGVLPRLAVAAGPAWHGYFGLQVDLRGAWPPDASLWLALVEAVPAGTDGTPVARQLLRSVSGPILPGATPAPAAGRDERWQWLQAMRWPDTAKPERLRARAWLEGADGRLLVVAQDRC